MNENPFNITREEVLELAARKLADHCADHEYIADSASSIIKERIENTMKNSVAAKIDTILTDSIESLMRREFQPVDSWGEPRGEKTNIRECLEKKAREFWEVKVNSNGEPASYGGKPRFEYIFGKIAGEEFAQVVKQNITNLVGAFKDAIKSDAQKVIGEHIDKIIQVKTK